MRNPFAAAIALGAALAAVPALADDKQYGPGVTDAEIKIGQTMPYSGPAAAYGAAGKASMAYWRMVNARGGVNGRKVTLVSLDDGYSPPRTVEQTRKLVEEDEVLAIVGSLGTPTNAAIQKYLNSRKVPHLLISTGASKWNNPQKYPFTTPFFPPYDQEAKIYGRWIARTMPDAKIGVLYQNDDFGRDYMNGLRAALGDKSSRIVKEATYVFGDQDLDAQMASLKDAGVDVLLTVASPKFAAKAIRKVGALSWKPTHIIASVAASISSVLEPAGLEASKGLITAISRKVVGDPRWDNDEGVKRYVAFMKEWYPEGNPADVTAQLGYNSAMMTEIILKACGDNLTRENLMAQATSFKKVSLPLFLPGVTVSISPKDYSTFDTFRLAKFDGKTWEFIGDAVTAAAVQ